jgi:hypothetical protein
MIIANPIYDVVFKYLLEDIEIALELNYPTHDKHQLEFTGDQSEPLVKKIIDRLGRAIASDEIREKMDVEDEIDKIFERELNKLAQIIAEKEQKIIIEKQKAENEKQKAEIERQKNEDLLKQIAELTKQLKNKS